MDDITTLDDYLTRYGPLLGQQAQETLDPLHVPGRDKLPDYSQFLRKPFPAQEHFIAASVKALRNQRAIMMIGEVGSGKTLCGTTTVHVHAAGRPYRALVFCPGHLVHKWSREIMDTIPGANVRHIDHCSDLNRLYEQRRPASHPEWFIIARDRAKLGSKWEPAAWKKRVGRGKINALCCPRCGQSLVDKDGVCVSHEWLAANQRQCMHCQEPLWRHTGPQQGGLDRFEPARYIHKRLKGYFDYLIADEIHEEKSATSAQGNAIGSLAAAAKNVIGLTGTLIGGYAHHIRPLLFRLCPRTLIQDGLGWKNESAFNRRYGRIERTFYEKQSGQWAGNRQSRGSARRCTEMVKPGIVPTLFGKHLLGNSVYLSLAEISDRLPPLREIVLPVQMGRRLAEEYQRVEKALVETNKDLLQKGSRRLLGAMIQTLLCYPDHPRGWNTVGYRDAEGGRHPVVRPADLGDGVDPKEEELLRICRAEKEAGRQCWVYVQYTGERNVQQRLVDLLEQDGFSVGQLKAAVPLAKREEWIADQGKDVDVVVSHPKLVETGLDLFCKRGDGHNYSSLIFYETGYNLFTLRQAARRAWRLGQRLECRVYYLYYSGTAQAAAMALMGKKLAAAQALEGKFSTDGLVAMGGEDASVEMALAQSLQSGTTEDPARCWATIGEVGFTPPSSTAQSAVEVEEDDFRLVGSRRHSIDLDDMLDDIDALTAGVGTGKSVAGELSEIDDLLALLE